MAESKTKTVLVVEDEAEIRHFVGRVLKLEGYRVLHAEDGATGLGLLKKTAVDLVLLDLRLPVRNGWSVMAHMKSEPGLATIPVIVFTASAGLSQHDQALRLGAAGYLIKPLGAKTLKRAVAALLGPTKRGQYATPKSTHCRC